MTQVHWVKSTNDRWLSFESVDLSGVSTKGVYIIWHAGNPSRVVRVGQGDVANRLRTHQRDNDILYYRRYGALLVTWAAVTDSYRDGVERYLADQWKPLVGDAWPNVRPVAVNSPW